MRIREATRRDAPRIAAIHAESWRAAYAGVLPRAYLRELRVPVLRARWRERIRRARRRGERVLVAEDEGVLGFAESGPSRHSREWAGHAGEVFMLYVDPRAQGRGAGTSLLSAASRELEARGAFWLHVWVLEENVLARSFYDSRGLRDDGARRLDRFHGETVRVARYARALNRVLDQLKP